MGAPQSRCRGRGRRVRPRGHPGQGASSTWSPRTKMGHGFHRAQQQHGPELGARMRRTRGGRLPHGIRQRFGLQMLQFHPRKSKVCLVPDIDSYVESPQVLGSQIPKSVCSQERTRIPSVVWSVDRRCPAGGEAGPAWGVLPTPTRSTWRLGSSPATERPLRGHLLPQALIQGPSPPGADSRRTRLPLGVRGRCCSCDTGVAWRAP